LITVPLGFTRKVKVIFEPQPVVKIKPDFSFTLLGLGEQLALELLKITPRA